MNKTRLNGIFATILACTECGMGRDAIAAKLATKYGVTADAAKALISAVWEVVS